MRRNVTYIVSCVVQLLFTCHHHHSHLNIVLILFSYQGHKGKKKGGAVRGEVEGGGLDWRGEFGHVVQILYQLLQLDLQQLWDPPSVTVMEDFTK